MLKAQRGSRYHQTGQQEVIGHCVSPECPGTLRVVTDGGGTSISCDLCPASWPPTSWIELRERMEAAADAHPGGGSDA